MKEFFNLLGKIARLLGSALFAAVLGGVTWLLWVGYEDARLQRRFVEEGQPVAVTVSEVSHENRVWYDAIGMPTYVSFSFRGKPYTTRFSADTAWVSTGDRLRLLYHPQLDAFRQPRVARKPGVQPSRLLEWSVTKGFSTDNLMLVGLVVVATLLLFVVGGIVGMLTGWAFLQTLARYALGAVLAAVGLFFTYDAVEYHRYDRHLRQHGQPTTATVLDTDQTSHGKHSTLYYTYQATVRLNGRDRLIRIAEEEYETLRPGDRLAVRYDPALDDATSAAYPLDYYPFFMPPVAWLFFGVWAWLQFFKKR